MKTLKFKTTINCGNCVRAVTPVLNGEKGIKNWEVDTASPDKILTVTTDLSAEQVQALVVDAGFEAQAA
jgi:copper chaperone CopZ